MAAIVFNKESLLYANSFHGNNVKGLCAPEATSLSMPGGQEKELQFCSKEKTLPDISLIHGRLLVAAWEEGLEVTRLTIKSCSNISTKYRNRKAGFIQF